MESRKERPTVFLCEPGQADADTMNGYLVDSGFDVRLVTHCNDAMDTIVKGVPDVVVLDVGLPDVGGYEVCRKVRPYYRGLIIIKGHERGESAQLLAFDRGADDYVVMPVSPALLSARIHAHLRRESGMADNAAALQIRAGELIIDATSREVLLGAKHLELTALQFELLWYLAGRSGRVVPREELYEAIYQTKYNGFDRSVDVQISRIRRHLGESPDNPTYLKTVRGVGYLFVGRSFHVL